ncbi:Uncharacterised protein [Amycolatopsis camponoti]|uniref:Uncharacterized protein n=1 Tax=Amycolatopsis camponoti TaxID=2606593 RepID=A0A6I8LVW2_9PSEU|nr:Uncharacterised protein [Amycolatopsis camponoti]
MVLNRVDDAMGYGEISSLSAGWSTAVGCDRRDRFAELSLVAQTWSVHL